MRISDWSSDVCSSDLISYPVVLEHQAHTSAWKKKRHHDKGFQCACLIRRCHPREYRICRSRSASTIIVRNNDYSINQLCDHPSLFNLGSAAKKLPNEPVS